MAARGLAGHVGGGVQHLASGFAHLCVLAAADVRGRGLARLAASPAVAHELKSGLLPQWRARSELSLAVARSLGFTELGPGQRSGRRWP